MRPAAAFVSCLLGACGGASASASGDLDGAPMPLVSATFTVDASASSFPHQLLLTSAPELCASLEEGRRPPGEARITIQLDRVDAQGRSLGIDAGEYEVIPPGQPVARGKESRLALVRAIRTNESCENSLVSEHSTGTSGTVTLEEAGATLRGRYTFSTAGSGPVAGTFTAPECRFADPAVVPECR